jgi:heptosyltransferase-2
MTILVFCPNLVGDTAMATPAFRALRAGFPGSRMVAVIKPGIAPTLDGSPWFDDRIDHDPRSSKPEERTQAVARKLRAERPDLAVLFPNSFRSALLAWRSGAKRRVGYARGGRGLLLTDRLRAPRDERGRFRVTPIVDYYREIPRTLGCPDDGPRLELFTTPEDEAAADRAWDRLGLPRSGPVVTLNTGGAFGPAKSWPAGHFSTLARRLVAEAGVSVLVVCGPGEREAAREIVRQADRPEVVSLAEEPMGIGLTKACIRRSSLMVTTDSGPRHFAVGFDVPVLTLFGPTRIGWTLTHHPRSLHLHHPVPCGPCQKPICPEGHHRCLRDLSPDAVFRAALRILRGQGGGVERAEAV